MGSDNPSSRDRLDRPRGRGFRGTVENSKTKICLRYVMPQSYPQNSPPDPTSQHHLPSHPISPSPPFSTPRLPPPSTQTDGKLATAGLAIAAILLTETQNLETCLPGALQVEEHPHQEVEVEEGIGTITAPLEAAAVLHLEEEEEAVEAPHVVALLTLEQQQQVSTVWTAKPG